MALRDQLLGLGSSVYNLAGAPFGGAGALQLGSGLSSLGNMAGGGLGGIAGGLSNLGGLAMPSIATGALGLPGLLGGLFGGMTEAQNRMDEVKDVMADRSRFQTIAQDPSAWLASQPSQFQDIDKAALSGKLSVPNFEDMLLGPENQTPELREALTGVMFGGAQQGRTGPQEGQAWHPDVTAMGFPWGHMGDVGAMGPSGHAQVDIPGWPAGMISPLETDIPPGGFRPREVGMMGDWMNRLYSQIHDPNYSLGLSTGGPQGLLQDFWRIGPEVRDASDE